MIIYPTAKQAGILDKYTQERIGVPGIVLMERAANLTAETIIDRLHNAQKGIYSSKADSKLKDFSKDRDEIVIVAEGGNNGGDAVAVGRILYCKGYKVRIIDIDGISNKTDSFKKQIEIIQKLGIRYTVLSEADDPSVCLLEIFKSIGHGIICEGLFGVGLSRKVEGVHKDVIDMINKFSQRGIYVVSIDIPSGINSNNGHIMGAAIRSDLTVTYQYIKYGMLVSSGREYSGDIVCDDIGIIQNSEPEWYEELYTQYGDNNLVLYEYTKDEYMSRLPVRTADSHKGTYGKVLIMAGSSDIYGAMYFAAAATYGVGAGLVKVITHKNNRDILAEKLPEAMILTYDDDGFDKIKVMEAVSWADVMLLGPGIGTSDKTVGLFNYMLATAHTGQKIVMDADALNIISQGDMNTYFSNLTNAVGKYNVVITPHPGEMARLYENLFNEEEDVRTVIQDTPDMVAKTMAYKFGIIAVLKGARTYIAGSGNNIYVNTTGNSAMSKGGSGDVLAGILAGLIAGSGSQNIYDTVCTGVRLHGLAGDIARYRVGEYSMTARDLIFNIPNAMK